MKPVDFAKLMAGLGSACRVSFTADDIEFWRECFGDLDDAVVTQAFIRFCCSGDPWPTVAKIRAMASEQVNGQLETAATAFDRVMKAVRRYGIYQPSEGLGTLDALTQAALAGCGGWSWACECTADNRQTLSAQFRKAYEAISQQEQQTRQTPESVRPRIGNTSEAAKLAQTMGIET